MKDRVVVITGASRGIGEAAARAFAEAGARLGLLARSAADLEALAQEIGPDRARAITCDVADFAQVEAAIRQTETAFGPIDVLINNAGMIGPVGHMEGLDPGDWSRTIDVNLKGVFHGMRAVLPGMAERGGGTIINVSSGAATGAVEGWSAYCASKAGALMLTRSGHTEYGERGLRVLGLSPGTVATEMQREIKASGVGPVARLEWSDHIPPEWPARALLWMCGPEADGWLGRDVSLRDEEVRLRVGLIA